MFRGVHADTVTLFVAWIWDIYCFSDRNSYIGFLPKPIITALRFMVNS